MTSPGASMSPRDLEAFDHFFFDHPLVRFHASHPEGASHRISDSLSTRAFRDTALYNEYYRVIGVNAVIAVPIAVDRRRLVSFVLNRAGRDFNDREREMLDVLRPSLAALYGHAAAQFDALPITAREREVLEWAARGKTNRDIATILSMSPRTVEKHLEHVYAKLSVETRTAAVMRTLKR